MITGEVESTSDLLNLNLAEMLECREKMCKDINELFGTNATVKSHVDLNGNGVVEDVEFKKGGNVEV